MAVSYNKLWKLLVDKKWKRIELQRKAKISANVLARLSKDEYVSMESMYKICSVLECGIGDVMDFVADSKYGET